MPGHFIQAGPTPSGTAHDGYGEFVTVDRLETRERERIKERLTTIRPDLLADGTKIVRAKLEADAAFEKFRTELHLGVGGDGIRTAVAILTEAASKQIATELAAKASTPKGK